MKGRLVLVLGGARSGKSRYAESLVTASRAPVTYIATAGPPRDEEMATRIKAHQVRRPAGWRTREVPQRLAEALAQDPQDAERQGVALIDCLTLWLSNVMLADEDVEAASAALLAALECRAGPVVAVSNEVGEGIVPATPLGRRFRDAQGVLNQAVAAIASDVVKVVAGIPVIVKPQRPPEIFL